MNTLVPPGPDAAGSIRQRADCLRTAPARLRHRIARISHALRALDAPSECAASSLRDYCHEILGVPARTFRGWADVGALVHAVPALGKLFVDGKTRWSALADIATSGLDPTPWLHELPELTTRQVRARLEAAARQKPGRVGPPAGVASSLHAPDPAFAPLSLRLPLSVVLYARATDDLAEALVGTECPEDDRWQALIAEASTEIEPTVAAAPACRRFRLDPEELAVTEAAGEGTSNAASSTLDSEPSTDREPSTTECSPSTSESPSTDQKSSRLLAFELPLRLSRPLLRVRGRDAVVRLQALLLRLLSRQRGMDRRLEGELLDLYRENAHRQLGFGRFEDFARELLDLPERSTWQRLQRARERLRDDPLARAYDRGRVSPMQLLLLKELQRLHVPDSALPRWIRSARETTIRGLRDRLAWARGQVVTDYRAWSLAGFPPPSWDQLRTSARSLEAVARSPEPPDIQQLATEPTGQLRVLLRKETIVHLVQLTASVQERAKTRYDTDVPNWLAFLHICVLARRAWAHQDPDRVPRRHRIHDRDGWRCAAPGCSSRRGMEAHHIQYRGHQGDDHPHNLISMCGFHHRIGEHGGRLRVRGRAVLGRFSLRFEMGRTASGKPLAVYQGEERLKPTPNADKATTAKNRLTLPTRERSPQDPGMCGA